MLNRSHINFLFRTCIVTIIVYLSFEYALPVLFPFLLGYLLMKFLLPLSEKIRKKLGAPSWYVNAAVIILFFVFIFSLIIFICWQTWRQMQLFLKNLDVYRQMYGNTISNITKTCCHMADYYLCVNDGSTYNFVTSQMAEFQSECTAMLRRNMTQIVSGGMGYITSVLTFFAFIIISMIILCKDTDRIEKAIINSTYGEALLQIRHKIKSTGLAYAKSQCVIILCNWFVCGGGMLLAGNPYFLLAGLFTALIDALPVLGSGIVLIPMGIYYAIKGKFMATAILITAYVITIFARELLEARLLGNRMEMLPFFMLITIYIGIKLFGIAGIILGPFGIVLIRCILDVLPPQTNSISYTDDILDK